MLWTFSPAVQSEVVSLLVRNPEVIERGYFGAVDSGLAARILRPASVYCLSGPKHLVGGGVTALPEIVMSASETTGWCPASESRRSHVVELLNLVQGRSALTECSDSVERDGYSQYRPAAHIAE
jgi:hypothetical protein